MEDSCGFTPDLKPDASDHTCSEVEAKGSVVLPSGAVPSTEQATKGADPRTGSLKVKRPVVLSELAVWVLVLVLRFLLALAGRAGSDFVLALALWALSW